MTNKLSTRYFNKILLEVVKAFFKDQCLTRASALTFSSLLALVPLLVVGFSIFSMLPWFDSMLAHVQTYVFENFVPHTGGEVLQYLNTFELQAKQLPTFGVVFLVVTALMMLINIETTLNALWGQRYKLTFNWSQLLFWSMIVIGPLLMGMSIALTSYLKSMALWQQVTLVGVDRLVLLIPFVVSWLSFIFLYCVVPHYPVKFKHALIGGFVAALLFELSKVIFGYYVSYFPTYKFIYGAMATIPLFLVWVYISWLIFLLGAEITKVLDKQAEA